MVGALMLVALGAAGIKKVDCSQKQGCRLPSKAHR